MLRVILVIAATVFATVSATANGDYNYDIRYSHKICHGKTWRGVAVDFPCNLDQICCFDRMRGKGYCANKSGRSQRILGRCRIKLGY